MQSRSIRRSGQPISASASIECGLMTGTRSAEGIMASGHANRANRPNTWLHRPATQREVLTCQPGAVHTWLFADRLDEWFEVSYLLLSSEELHAIAHSGYFDLS